MPTPLIDATEYIQQEINNDNSHNTVKSRLTFISAFSIMVTVTLMKTAVAKNLSQSIIICVELECGTTKPYFWGCPGMPWLPLRDATERSNQSSITKQHKKRKPQTGD